MCKDIDKSWWFKIIRYIRFPITDIYRSRFISFRNLSGPTLFVGYIFMPAVAVVADRMLLLHHFSFELNLCVSLRPFGLCVYINWDNDNKKMLIGCKLTQFLPCFSRNRIRYNALRDFFPFVFLFWHPYIYLPRV